MQLNHRWPFLEFLDMLSLLHKHVISLLSNNYQYKTFDLDILTQIYRIWNNRSSSRNNHVFPYTVCFVQKRLTIS